MFSGQTFQYDMHSSGHLCQFFYVLAASTSGVFFYQGDPVICLIQSFMFTENERQGYFGVTIGKTEISFCPVYL